MDMKKCHLYENLTQDRSEWRNKICVADRTQLGQGFDDDDDDAYLKWNVHVCNNRGPLST